jgi:hypothetical protein
MWKAAVLGTNILLFAMTMTKAWKRWPALYAYVAAMCAQQDLALYASFTQSGPLYWWTYYIGDAILAIAQVALITEISLKLVGPLKCLRAIAARNVPAMTVVFIFGALLAAASGHLHNNLSRPDMIEYYCRRLDLAAAAGCFGALIMLCGIALSLKIQFTHGVKPVVIGLLIEVSFSYAQAALFMDGWIAQTVWPGVRSLAYVTTLVFFAATALPPQQQRGHSRIQCSSVSVPSSKGVRVHVA